MLCKEEASSGDGGKDFVEFVVGDGGVDALRGELEGG